MLSLKSNPLSFNQHQKQYLFEITQTISYCSKCSCAIITDKTGKTVSTIQPMKFHIHENLSLPTFLHNSHETHKYHFINDKLYNNIRGEFVKKMKFNCKKLNLNFKTYFAALDYFDRICSRFEAFDSETLNQISDLCIILSAKLNEDMKKGREVENTLGKSSKKNFGKDELYLLKTLNYDLIRNTSYDILIDIIKCGFIFNDEEFQEKKINFIYDKLENMIFLFSESKHWIYMSPKEIAMGIVGWARNFLGLVPFSKNIQIVFLSEFSDIHNYIKCFNKMNKCFKIKGNKPNEENKNNNVTNRNSNNNINNNNNSDSTKEGSNSDNN